MIARFHSKVLVTVNILNHMELGVVVSLSWASISRFAAAPLLIIQSWTTQMYNINATVIVFDRYELSITRALSGLRLSL